jgi:hypothetical protein
MVQHVIQLHEDAEKHANLAMLDEFLAWEDETIETQLSTQAKRLWNKTEMDYEQMIQNEHQAQVYLSQALQEQQESLIEQQEADQDGYRYNTLYRLAQEEAYQATHLKEDYCDRYFVPSFWCRWVGQFAGWDSIQAQQAMQATNDMQLALYEEQAANHAAQMARLYRSNATFHAQLANTSEWQAELWNVSYQRDKGHAQQLDAQAKTLRIMSREEIDNATQYAVEAKQEWQQAISLAKNVMIYQKEAVFYAIMAILFASSIFFLVLYHLVKKFCRNLAKFEGWTCDQETVLLRALYVAGHICIFLLVLGSTLRDENGHVLLLLQHDVFVSVMRENRGGIILIFAMQAACVQWLCFHMPSGLHRFLARHQQDVSCSTSLWPDGLIHAMGGLLKHVVLPAALFCMEMLILINLRSVAIFAIGDTTWLLLFILLFLISAIHFLVTLPKPQADLVSSSSTSAVVSEKTPLVMVDESTISFKTLNDCNKDGECVDSNHSESLVDVELASTPTPCSSSQPSSHVHCCCSPRMCLLFDEEIMSIRNHASFLKLPLALLILVRSGNLILFSCLPTLYRLRPGMPTWIVPIVMMVVAVWVACQAVVTRSHDIVVLSKSLMH